MVILRPSRASRLASRPSPLEDGFTLLELLIVMVVIAILAAMAIPSYTRVVTSAREAALKEDLYVMRKAIDSYTVDKARAPQSLQDLVSAGYLKAIPKDPFTGHNDSWTTTQSDTHSTVDQRGHVVAQSSVVYSMRKRTVSTTRSVFPASIETHGRLVWKISTLHRNFRSLGATA